MEESDADDVEGGIREFHCGGVVKTKDECREISDSGYSCQQTISIGQKYLNLVLIYWEMM